MEKQSTDPLLLGLRKPLESCCCQGWPRWTQGGFSVRCWINARGQGPIGGGVSLAFGQSNATVLTDFTWLRLTRSLSSKPMNGFHLRTLGDPGYGGSYTLFRRHVASQKARPQAKQWAQFWHIWRQPLAVYSPSAMSGGGGNGGPTGGGEETLRLLLLLLLLLREQNASGVVRVQVPFQAGFYKTPEILKCLSLGFYMLKNGRPITSVCIVLFPRESDSK